MVIKGGKKNDEMCPLCKKSEPPVLTAKGNALLGDNVSD